MNIHPYTAVLFDMDGTLLDTLDDIYYALNHTLSLHHVATITREQCRTFVGSGAQALIERAAPQASDALQKEIIQEFIDTYQAHCFDNVHPYEGIPELLGDLRRANIRTAVVSNKSDSAVQDLADRFFPNCFDYALGAVEGRAKKPDPAMINQTLAQLHANTASACYVGDSEVDVASTINAQIDGFFCTWGFREASALLEAGAKASQIVSTTDELRRHLLPSTRA